MIWITRQRIEQNLILSILILNDNFHVNTEYCTCVPLIGLHQGTRTSFIIQSCQISILLISKHKICSISNSLNFLKSVVPGSWADICYLYVLGKWFLGILMYLRYIYLREYVYVSWKWSQGLNLSMYIRQLITPLPMFALSSPYIFIIIRLTFLAHLSYLFEQVCCLLLLNKKKKKYHKFF